MSCSCKNNGKKNNNIIIGNESNKFKNAYMSFINKLIIIILLIILTPIVVICVGFNYIFRDKLSFILPKRITNLFKKYKDE